MAAIKAEKTKVIPLSYWYVNEQGERKPKWYTVNYDYQAKSPQGLCRSSIREKYAGQAIVPWTSTYFQRVADEKGKMGKEGWNR